jgi:hypothetical protein
VLKPSFSYAWTKYDISSTYSSKKKLELLFCLNFEKSMASILRNRIFREFKEDPQIYVVKLLSTGEVVETAHEKKGTHNKLQDP